MLQEDDVLLRATEPPFLSALHVKNDTTNFLAINLASQQKTTKLHFSSQVRKQFKLLTVPLSHYAVFLRSDKLVNCHVLNSAKIHRDLIRQSIRTFYWFPL